MSEWKKTTINGGEDRLSSLPDALLITILSLLDYPWEIVRTCFLSKRWRHLWTFVPCLDFKDKYFKEIKKRGNFPTVNIARFKKFVSSFLRQRDDATALHTFNLKHQLMPYSMSWIHYALGHKPKNVRLDLYTDYYICGMLDCLFTCESLEDLYLDIFVDLSVPEIVFLPKLKNLQIKCKSIKGNCVEELVSRCHALESLTLKCDMKMENNISFHNVKQLYLHHCRFENELKVNEQTQDTRKASDDILTRVRGPHSTFYISAPCLEYLKFSGNVGFATKLKDMSKVKNANIKIHQWWDKPYNCDLLSSLLNVENLMLVNTKSDFILKEICEGELPNCPIFHKMKKLTIGRCCMHCGFGSLCSFLKHCPNLEILTLFHSVEDCQDHDKNLEDENSEEIKRFDCELLKLVDVVYSCLKSDADRLIRRLVQSTIGIENIQINLTEEKD